MSTPSRPVRVANCSGFYGDRLSAAAEMVTGGPIDVLTGDWLAELTMGILHRQRSRDPERGFATTFLTQMEQVLGTCSERGIRVVSNAGGAHPVACAESVRTIVDRLGLSLTVAVVDGDDLTDDVGRIMADGAPAPHMVTGRPFADLGSELLAANAYLGAWGIVEALDAGADIVVTGRVTDASVVVAPAAHHFGWRRDSWDELAGAVVAGHVIECGTQATGGNLSFFREVADLRRPGFPLAEIHHDGSSVITKHAGTGGAVTVDTVTAQLLYEVDGPRYANPDVVARLDTVRLEQLDDDRVLVSGVRGEPAPDTIKVGLLAAPGWRSTVLLGLAGRHIDKKTEVAVDAIAEAVPGGLAAYDDVRVELIGSESEAPASMGAAACILAVSVSDADRDLVDRFSRAVVEIGLATYPGFFLFSPPARAAQYTVFWPTLLPADAARQRVHFDGRTWHPEPAPRAAVPRVLPEPAEWLPLRLRRPLRPQEPTTPRALGEILGARSGDKAGNATLGLWARSDTAYRWLTESFDVEALRTLVPELGDVELRPWALPNLRAVGVTAVGYLGHGVGANLALDPQAKSLGEYVLAHRVELPEALTNELEEQQ